MWSLFSLHLIPSVLCIFAYDPHLYLKNKALWYHHVRVCILLVPPTHFDSNENMATMWACEGTRNTARGQAYLLCGPEIHF
jgi:hypothetical protein